MNPIATTGLGVQERKNLADISFKQLESIVSSLHEDLLDTLALVWASQTNSESLTSTQQQVGQELSNILDLSPSQAEEIRKLAPDTNQELIKDVVLQTVLLQTHQKIIGQVLSPCFIALFLFLFLSYLYQLFFNSISF